MSMAMTTQLGGQLGNLLNLVQNLDEQIKASESARQYAEEKLIEMALQKIDVCSRQPPTTLFNFFFFFCLGY